ncbi:MAG: helix-turn-helix transcriptional regulator [Verrucomicrobia bacterium]|nr:helix-turn-helix transcriptional regulator [Deltaproteobacteria bacterium]
MSYGERLKIVRGNIPQEDFAKLLDVHKNTLGRFEREEGKPNIEELQKILSALPDINPTWLLTGEGDVKRDAANKSEGDASRQTEKPKLREIGGEPVPQPTSEYLDRRLLALTLSRLDSVFEEFKIEDPDERAGVITDVYSSIVERNLVRNQETVDGVAKNVSTFFKDFEKLSSIGPNIFNMISKWSKKIK